MRERPILFSGEMVRAILAGRKTQTRRVVKLGKLRGADADAVIPLSGARLLVPSDGVVMSVPSGGLSRAMQDTILHCPYGKPGDRLWVKETFRDRSAVGQDWRQGVPVEMEASWIEYRADYPDGTGGPWSPSIFMRRTDSRLTLEITDVGVERVQAIHRRDVPAEGLSPCAGCDGYHSRRCTCVDNFRQLWDLINEKRGFGWEKNPWVWVVEFKVMQP